MGDEQEILDMVEEFNSHIFALFFPNLSTPAGEELLAGIISYVLSCDSGIKDNCPKLWYCYWTNKVAYLLSTWPVSVGQDDAGDGQVEVTPVSQEPILYLKKRTIGQKTCEWEKYEPKCNNCGDNVISQFKFMFENALQTCQLACEDLLIIGGSNFPDCPTTSCGGCGSNDKI